MEEPQQAKRRRRSSVRLGEIGFAAPYDASSLWIEPVRQRRKSADGSKVGSGSTRSSRSPGAKAPRIRPLEQLAREAAAAVEEDWSVVEAADGSSPAKGRLARRVFHRKVGVKGSRLGVESPETGADEEEKEIVPSGADFEVAIASTSSDSEELLGSDLKGEEEDEEEEEVPGGDSGNADGSDGSEEGRLGVKPHRHGDEMQGAIEDGPGRMNGKVVMSFGKRRSGRQALIRDLASRDHVVVGDSGNRDTTTAGEPSSGRGVVANGTTTVVTPSSSQRGLLLPAGVGGWLLELGLGRYLELFERNEVDTEVLPLLTFEDLREMGVDAVGARRKMFNGIQELGQIRGI